MAREAWKHARSVIEAGTHRLVVLDEITYPMNWGWIDTDEVVSTMRERPESVSIVATGRDAPAALIDVADTVTEMRNVKHAYDVGIVAKKGIDY
jgi:cob(I)alamin adenosyltransferase